MQGSMEVSNVTLTEMCVRLPPMVNSGGVWDIFVNKHSPVEYSLPRLELQMIIIFLVTQTFYLVFKRFGITKFSSQLFAGIMLGPAVAGRYMAYRKHVIPFKSQEAIGTLGGLGYTLFLFIAGVKMDLSMIKKSGRKAMYTGVASLLMPLILGVLTQSFVSTTRTLDSDEKMAFVVTVGLQSMTPFPVVATLLNELDLINSELGRVGLSSAMVSDLFSLFLTCIASLARIGFEVDYAKALIDLGAVVAYIFVVVLICRPAMFWVIRQTPEGRPVKDAYICIIVVAVLGSGLISNWFDLFVLFGPFVFGLAVPDGPPLGSTLVDKLECIVSDLFLPLFVTTCGMRAEVGSIEFNSRLMRGSPILISVLVVAKLSGCLLPALFSRMPKGDALALALIMNSQGIVEMGHYSFLRDSQTIPDELFAFVTLVILVTSIVVPVLVKFLYDPSRKYAGYQKRNIISLRANAELRILACIQKADDIAPTINLLELACPTRETPISVYVLHLIELVGRASPIFISHQMQKKTISSYSYSENVIISFRQYERHNLGSLQVNIFTAISPPKHMDEDISTLALNKLTSLILLPFHRKWSIAGSVDTEDNHVRALNCSVLNRAPCSIGIVVDRGYLGRSSSMVASSESSYSVAVIFFGGNDDREALTFAKRMAKDPSISLSVIRFIATSDEGVTDWEKMLDSEELKDVKQNTLGEGYVIYVEEMVKDGPETALIIRSMVDEYDLIIVGRRHGVEIPQTSGLSEWSEFPELGTIGDLLASADLNSKASVLVVQQQQQK